MVGIRASSISEQRITLPRQQAHTAEVPAAQPLPQPQPQPQAQLQPQPQTDAQARVAAQHAKAKQAQAEYERLQHHFAQIQQRNKLKGPPGSA